MLYIPHFIHTRYTSCLDTPGFMGIQPVLHGLPLPMRGISEPCAPLRPARAARRSRRELPGGDEMVGTSWTHV